MYFFYRLFLLGYSYARFLCGRNNSAAYGVNFGLSAVFKVGINACVTVGCGKQMLIYPFALLVLVKVIALRICGIAYLPNK